MKYIMFTLLITISSLANASEEKWINHHKEDFLGMAYSYYYDKNSISKNGYNVLVTTKMSIDNEFGDSEANDIDCRKKTYTRTKYGETTTNTVISLPHIKKLFSILCK